MSFSDSLSQTVRYWSDYNKLYYHPKSTVEFPHLMHRDFEEPMSFFQQGEDALNLGHDTVKIIQY